MFYKECRTPRFTLLLTVLLGLALSFTACTGASGVEKHLSRGEEYLKQRKFREAVMEFRAASELDKNSAEAHWGLARAFEMQGEMSDAIAELQQVALLAPENLEAKTKLGNYFLLLNPPQAAETEKLLGEIFAVNPNFVEAHVLKASLMTVQNKPEAEILAVLENAIALEPNRVETYVSLARFFMRLNRGAQAEETIKKAIAANEKSSLGYLEYGRFLSYADRPQEAETQFKRAVEIAPQDFETREALAVFYLGERRLEEAEQAYKDLSAAMGDSPEGRVELANFYAGIGREPDAVAVFEQILVDAPEYARARYRLGEIYLDRKEFAKVSEQTEKLLAANDTDAEALLLRARLRIQENNPEEAVKDLEEILKKQPSLKSALFYMTQARLALGQTEQARAFIGDLERYHPQYLYSRLLKIQASFAAGEPEMALRQSNELIELVGRTRPSAEMSGQALEDVRVRAISSRGSAFLDLNKLAEARADLQEVVRLSPNSANAYVNLAKAAARQNAGEAVGYYEKAISIEPKNFDALTGLVGVFKGQGNFPAAHERVDRAVAENAGQKAVLPALYYLKADVFRAQRDFAAAESELQKSFEADENYLPAYSAYASLLMEQNQTERAIEQYRKIVEKKPSAAVYTLLGMLEDARENSDEAEKNYRRALEINPATPIAANNLAWIIADGGRGNLDEALRLAQGAADKSASAGFYDTLGWIYYKKGLMPPAVEQLKKAVSLDAAEASRAGRTANPGYRVRLAAALASAGDNASARREAEIALQNENALSAREAADAKNLLARL